MQSIYYGITSEGNISRNIGEWIKTAGPPVVFAEKDENLALYSNGLLESYEVVSLDEALKRYPDADVWVTYRKAGNSAKALLNKLPPERIHFLEADLEYRKGCGFLGRFISYRKDTFSPCCVTGECPVVPASGTVRERLSHWQEYTGKLVDDVRMGRANDCQDCYLLTFGPWQKSIKLREINFGSNQPGDICNFRCTYCFCERTFERLKNATDGLTTYEILKQISEIPEYDTNDFIVQLANGEFCANKHCDEMLDILSKTKWKIELLSNLSIYKEKLADIMDSGRITSLLVSLDSGTRETFKAIKRVDAFDRVVANLRKYPVSKTKLMLKYIFLDGVNDNETDVDGFYDLVKENGGIISLSSNLSAPFTKKMLDMSLRLIRKAKVDGIEVSSRSSYLSKEDKIFINESIASA